MSERDLSNSESQNTESVPPTTAANFRVPDGAPEGTLPRGAYRPDDEPAPIDDEAGDERPLNGADDEMARFDAVSGAPIGEEEWQIPSPYDEDTTDYSALENSFSDDESGADWPENRVQSTAATVVATTNESVEELRARLQEIDDQVEADAAITAAESVEHVPSPYDENAPHKDRELELVEHLGELRTRLLWCVGAIFLAMMGTWQITPQIQLLIVRPVKSVLARLNIPSEIITIDPTEGFLIYFNISLISAIILVMPFLMFQIWRFVEPALTKRERRFSGILIPFSVVLFFSGCALGYATSPLFFSFFAGFQPAGSFANYSYSSVAVLLAKMLLIFGICFQVPVITIFLNKAGLVSRNVLIEYWRHVVVVIFTVVAILTPTWDPVTLIVCASPPCLLYLLSIWLVKWL